MGDERTRGVGRRWQKACELGRIGDVLTSVDWGREHGREGAVGEAKRYIGEPTRRNRIDILPFAQEEVGVASDRDCGDGRGLWGRGAAGRTARRDEDVKGKKYEPHLATALWTSPGNPFTRRQSARMGADQAPWGAHILQGVHSP